jgi:hypothetical protein
MKLLNLLSGTQFKRSFLAAAVAASCATSAFAALPAFSFNPASLCTTGTCSNFTADNILVSDFSTVNFTSATNFTESGYLKITGFQLGATQIMPAGFNSNYSLYIPFTGTGHLISGNTNLAAGTTGQFDTLTYQLIGASGNVNGTSAFNSGTVLGTGSLLGGFNSTTPSNSSPGFVPTANIDFTFTPVLSSFFTSPVPFYNLGFAAFTNTSTQIAATANGFTITQGGGALNFDGRTQVPEPTTVALLGLGLLGVAASRRKSAKNKNA